MDEITLLSITFFLIAGMLWLILREEVHLRRMSEMEKQRSAMLTILSHQLRTPLTSSRWNMEMLRSAEFGKLSAKQRNALRRIDAGVSEAVNILNTFLVTMKAKRRLIARPMRINLAAGVRQALKSFAGIMHQRGIRVLIKSERTVNPIIADPSIFPAILNVLLENAILYTPSRGLVEIRIAKRKKSVVVEVRDAGIGIPRSEQRSIFKEFYRGKRASLLSPYGNGLGLYLAKTLADRSGYSLSFQSRENKGTTFLLAIPVGKGGEV